MRTVLNHNAFKQVAGILIVGWALTILFGEGAHLHTIFGHFDNHGEVHVLFHAHSNEHHTDKEESHAESKDHKHEVSSFDISGILVSVGKADIIIDSTSNLFITTAVIFSEFVEEPDYLFNLPPPNKPFYQYHPLSFSLRGPPIA